MSNDELGRYPLRGFNHTFTGVALESPGHDTLRYPLTGSLRTPTEHRAKNSMGGQPLHLHTQYGTHGQQDHPLTSMTGQDLLAQSEPSPNSDTYDPELQFPHNDHDWATGDDTALLWSSAPAGFE